MKIDNEILIEKNILLEEMNSVILSTIDNDGIPNASYAPIAIDNENNFLIYISKLSKHTNNLIQNKKASIMFIEDESKASNIFARKRLTINVDVEIIERSTIDWYEKLTYLDQKFGETIKVIKGMKDFHLFQLNPKNGLIVYGFGKAFRLNGRKLDEIVPLNDRGHLNGKKSSKKVINQ